MQHNLINATKGSEIVGLSNLYWKENNGELLISFSQLQTSFEGILSGLRQFLATQSPLKLMKNDFYFTLKALFVLKVFKFLSWLFSHVEKRLD